jgi:phasin family protein
MAEPRQQEKASENRQERGSAQPNQQSEPSAATNRTAQTAADVSGRAARIGVEVVKQNTKAAQHFWEASTQMAIQLTEQATQQVGRAFGITGGDANEVLQKSSKNLDAVLESANVIAAVSEDFSRQWLETARRVMEGTIKRSEALAECRTPHDLFALQVDLARENLNTVLHGARRLSELSGRAAQEATTKMSERIRQVA